MMKRTFRQAGGIASKIKNKKDSLKSIGKSVLRSAGKLTPGGAVVGNLKDIRDRKSILNKKTETKKEKQKRFNKKAMPPFDLKKPRPKRLGELPKGKPKRLGELPKKGKPQPLSKGGRKN